jgi:hypothetical protein
MTYEEWEEQVPNEILLPPKVVRHRYSLLGQITALLVVALNQQKRYGPKHSS